MTKHDRLMNALAEIKAICSKQEDADLGCGKRCPFLMGEDEYGFRGCEVIAFTRQDTNEPIDTPEEWGEPPESEDNTDNDRCYECRGYGDDYYIDEDGELVSACSDCPFNEPPEDK